MSDARRRIRPRSITGLLAVLVLSACGGAATGPSAIPPTRSPDVGEVGSPTGSPGALITGTLVWTLHLDTTQVNGSWTDHIVRDDRIEVSFRGRAEGYEWIDAGSTFTRSGRAEMVTAGGGCPDSRTDETWSGSGSIAADPGEDDSTLSALLDAEFGTMKVEATIAAEMHSHTVDWDWGTVAGAPGCESSTHDDTQSGNDWMERMHCGEDPDDIFSIYGQVSQDGHTADFACTESHDQSKDSSGLSGMALYTVSGTLTITP